MKKKVLVICYGNACRSQITEGYLRYYSGEQIEVFSAGIEAEQLHPFAVQVMHEDGIDISGQYSKEVKRYSADHFDYVLTVCEEAHKIATHIFSYARIIHIPFPDPANFQGREEERIDLFREVREQIKKFVIKFIGKEIYPSLESMA